MAEGSQCAAFCGARQGLEIENNRKTNRHIRGLMY
jgi:hypothetical protein